MYCTVTATWRSNCYNQRRSLENSICWTELKNVEGLFRWLIQVTHAIYHGLFNSCVHYISAVMLLLYQDKAKCLNGFPTTHINDSTRGIVAHSKSNYRHWVVVAKSYHSKASFSGIFIKVKSLFSRNGMRASFLREEKKKSEHFLM